VSITPPLFTQDDAKRRILLTLNMNKVVQHIWEAIRCENTEALTPQFDSDHPLRFTSDMRAWYTGKPSPPPSPTDRPETLARRNP
jgi:type III restriction enzyme